MPLLYDLRSDTQTRPTSAMRAAIAAAEVGDDMNAEDPTVNRLEETMAALFGKEAAVLACSGTQSNQMGVRCHCQPGDELLIHELGHIANFEAGGPAVLSGVTCRLLPGAKGFLDLETLAGKVRADNQHLCRTRLVCVENTSNAAGGYAWPLEQLNEVGQWAHSQGLKVHMDGARVFNACVARGYSPAEMAEHVDTISICFSKGLGCPMGSILVGSTDEIARARRARKLFGGALRQAGIMAAACQYAIDNNIDRLADDHRHARTLAEGIAAIDGLQIDPAQVETNLVFFDVDPARGNASQFSAALRERGVGINAAGSHTLRACTHLDVTPDDVEATLGIMREAVAAGFDQLTGTATGPYARA